VLLDIRKETAEECTEYTLARRPSQKNTVFLDIRKETAEECTEYTLARRLSLPQVKSKKAKVKSTENYLFNQAAFGGPLTAFR